MKVLIARTDRLGDVVLSLPVFAWLRQTRPDWELHALVAPACVPLLEHDPAVARSWIWTEADAESLAARLAAERFDAAVLLWYDAPLARLLRRIGIPRRIGPLSKWSSWLLLNRGVRQGRSRGKRHERDYNLQLAEKLAGRGAGWPEPRLHLSAGQREAGRRFRAEALAGLERASGGPAGTVAFVHPGSGGSALTWPPERFGQVARRLAAREGWRVYVTGGPADAAAVAAAVAEAGSDVRSLAGRYDLRAFLGILSGGDLLIGPSTGPLHMAAALGLAVAAPFSPVPTQSVARWGPRGPFARAVPPQVRCPARLDCWGERCRFWNCMERVEVEAVVASALVALAMRGEADDEGEGPG